jgi:hypothetical protein
MFRVGELITAVESNPGLVGYKRHIVLLGIKVNPGDVDDPFFGKKPRQIADVYDTTVKERYTVWWAEEDWKRVEELTEQFELL